MKRILLFVFICSIFFACNTRKQVEKAVSYGNYDQAISTALKKLSTNKTAKRKQDYIVMLEDAYHKALERDLSTIELHKKNDNPEVLRDIFELYSNLDARQEAVKPLLPLLINGESVSFKFSDYSNQIVAYKEKVSDYLYEKGLNLLESDNKYTIREAYNVLDYVQQINPNYEDTPDLLEEAHARGTHYILVSINNETQQIIPARLQEDLLNFDTYGLNHFWSTYHASQNDNIKYDYAMHLNLQQINISPERLIEREIVREREVVDGWEYRLDRNGNVMKDSLGNDIKVDKIVNVKCRLREIKQFKSSQVLANAVYVDLNSNQLLDSFPIDSGFIFEHFYAKLRGDRRALDEDDRILVNNRPVPFPSNEQMIFDTGEDLKLKLKHIISRQRFNVNG